MQHTDICDILKGEKLDAQVTLCGWVRTSRDSKNVAFLEVNDGTSLKHIQVVVDKSVIADPSPFMKLGTAVRVVGRAVKGMVQNAVEVNAEKIEVLGECPGEYPLQKKRHTLEYLRTIPHLRVRTNTFNAVFRVRSVVSFAIHQFFRKSLYLCAYPHSHR